VGFDGQLSDKQEQQLRAMLARCDEVRVERVVVLSCVSEEAVEQAVELLSAPAVRPPPRLSLELESPFHNSTFPRQAFTLHLQTPFAAPPDPADAVPVDREPPSVLDFLRPLACTDGTSHRLLLVTPEHRRLAAGTGPWARSFQEKSLGLASIRSPFPDVPAVVLTYTTSQAAAAALHTPELWPARSRACPLPLGAVCRQRGLTLTAATVGCGEGCGGWGGGAVCCRLAQGGVGVQ
jgi:hypothetical protein